MRGCEEMLTVAALILRRENGVRSRDREGADMADPFLHCF